MSKLTAKTPRVTRQTSAVDPMLLSDARRPSQKMNEPIAVNTLQRRRVWWVVFVLAVASIATGTIVSLHIRQQLKLQTVGDVEQAVARHYLLPHEQPLLASVTDASKLTTPFLRQAQDGDKILIYADTRIAIIYRPSIDRIVAVGPVDIQAGITSTTQ